MHGLEKKLTKILLKSSARISRQYDGDERKSMLFPGAEDDVRSFNSSGHGSNRPTTNSPILTKPKRKPNLSSTSSSSSSSISVLPLQLTALDLTVLMEIDRVDGRTRNQLRPLTCSRNVLNRAHGSARWSQGDTIVLAAVYGPKAGTRKNENPEKASIDVIWKPKSGQMGKEEKECETILRRTMQSICLLTVNPNTTTSIILQVVNDDGALLPCAINAASVALVDAGIPLKHLAVAVSCGLEQSGFVLLDPTKLEEKNAQAFTYMVFPSSVLSVLPEATLQVEVEKTRDGTITSVNHGVMSVDDYLQCLERGHFASAKMSDFLRRKLAVTSSQ